MEHIYQNIDGWFDFTNFYSTIVDRLSDNFVFVEIGVWKGKSISYFAVESLKKNKKGTIYAVDHWLGSKEHQKNSWAYDPLTESPEALYKEYCKNIDPIRNYIIDIKNSSEQASKNFTNNSIDAMFIDASHDYDNVCKDIESWLPKLKLNGIMSGHDYNWKKVKKAVDHCAKKYGFKIKQDRSVWEYYV